MKTIILGTFLLICCTTLGQAQEKSISPKTKRIEFGIYSEGGKTFLSPNKNKLTAPYHLAAGIAFRYRLSERFKIAAGFAYALQNTPYYYFEGGKYYSHSDYVIISEKYSEQLLQLPIALQFHFNNQRFFVSTGFELFAKINSTYYSYNRYIQTEVVFERKIVYSGLQGFDAQFLAGFGWNFKAFNNNQFSLESNLKVYPNFNYSPIRPSTTLTPNLRLNWYMIK